ncbi:MAG: hypothetical protein DWH80_06580 [Planctomycetota bacterium]|nr:MAG: hypothetical protein DWH80_06580 [Planctomycetota bacterium]
MSIYQRIYNSGAIFFADTYKIGYANETVFREGKRTDLHDLLVKYGVVSEKNFDNSTNIIDTLTNITGTQFDSIAVLNSTIGVQAIVRESLIDSTTGAANLDASTMTVEAATSYLLDSPLVDVNGALEVLQ